jgi:hypothetical protein
MNTIKLFIISLFVLGLGTQVQAAEYRLFDLGLDGNEHYYRVSCHDPYVDGSVIVKYEEKSIPGLYNRPSDRPSAEGEGLPPKRSSAGANQLVTVAEICSIDADDETQCRKRWSVAAAAQEMCK